MNEPVLPRRIDPDMSGFEADVARADPLPVIPGPEPVESPALIRPEVPISDSTKRALARRARRIE